MVAFLFNIEWLDKLTIIIRLYYSFPWPNGDCPWLVIA
jgi:hypothetical protein